MDCFNTCKDLAAPMSVLGDVGTIPTLPAASKLERREAHPHINVGDKMLQGQERISSGNWGEPKNRGV